MCRGTSNQESERKRGNGRIFLEKSFAICRKSTTFALAIGKAKPEKAEIAQLVEHNLAKVGVASSSLVFRSKKRQKEFFEKKRNAQVAEW